MSTSIEQDIKSQYAKIFLQKDWKLFKKTAEYYFQTAATLKKKNITSVDNHLLLRNIQKRLFLGIGGELLIKAYYLKNGCYINKPIDTNTIKSKKIKFTECELEKINEKETFSFNELIDNLNKIDKFENWGKIKTALKILKVFRNKEGHVVTDNHKFEQSTYNKIEDGLQVFFQEAFSEELTIKISMGLNENGFLKKKN